MNNHEWVTLLLDWYYLHKRDYPWRRTKDPYFVWISEIMLQQTRIETVIPYYYRFLSKIPDIATLAQIPIEELLKLWEGLGYYQRARHLKEAAIMIMRDYQGVFPSTYEEIIKLPGIGEYTAAAIASICFGEDVVVIDGNVCRVYTRFFQDSRDIRLASTKKAIKEDLKRFLPSDSAGFNEALMELGEVICVPKREPLCWQCPIQDYCGAFRQQNWKMFPVLSVKKKAKTFHYTVFLLRCDGKYAINQRETMLLQGLWEFPNVEGKLKKQEIQKYFQDQGVKVLHVQKSILYKHVFSHQIWFMQAYLVQIDKRISSYAWKEVKEIDEKCAIPSAFQPFLQEIKKK